MDERIIGIKKRADNGDADAQISMGNYYRDCLEERSYETAAKYYQLAADQGNDIAQAELAVLYEKGLGVEQSYKKAVELFKLSADQGNPFSMFELGVCYEVGLGVEKDMEQARYWISMSDKIYQGEL